jgi:hypothetical protein
VAAGIGEIVATTGAGSQTASLMSSKPGECRRSPRKFHSFSAAVEEVKNARVFAGIHFRTACVDGAAIGIAVADYAKPMRSSRWTAPGETKHPVVLLAFMRTRWSHPFQATTRTS